jgi:hypothetical protein
MLDLVNSRWLVGWLVGWLVVWPAVTCTLHYHTYKTTTTRANATSNRSTYVRGSLIEVAIAYSLGVNIAVHMFVTVYVSVSSLEVEL